MLGEFNIPHVRVYKEQQTMRAMSASPPFELVWSYCYKESPKNPFNMDFPGHSYKSLNNAAFRAYSKLQ